MSDKEKEIMNTIIKGLPKMTEFEKGYMLGIVEGKVSEKEQKKKEASQLCKESI